MQVCLSLDSPQRKGIAACADTSANVLVSVVVDVGVTVPGVEFAYAGGRVTLSLKARKLLAQHLEEGNYPIIVETTVMSVISEAPSQSIHAGKHIAGSGLRHWRRHCQEDELQHCSHWNEIHEQPPLWVPLLPVAVSSVNVEQHSHVRCECCWSFLTMAAAQGCERGL